MTDFRKIFLGVAFFALTVTPAYSQCYGQVIATPPPYCPPPVVYHTTQYSYIYASGQSTRYKEYKTVKYGSDWVNVPVVGGFVPTIHTDYCNNGVKRITYDYRKRVVLSRVNYLGKPKRRPVPMISESSSFDPPPRTRSYATPKPWAPREELPEVGVRETRHKAPPPRVIDSDDIRRGYTEDGRPIPKILERRERYVPPKELPEAPKETTPPPSVKKTKKFHDPLVTPRKKDDSLKLKPVPPGLKRPSDVGEAEKRIIPSYEKKKDDK